MENKHFVAIIVGVVVIFGGIGIIFFNATIEGEITKKQTDRAGEDANVYYYLEIGNEEYEVTFFVYNKVAVGDMVRLWTIYKFGWRVKILE